MQSGKLDDQYQNSSRRQAPGDLSAVHQPSSDDYGKANLLQIPVITLPKGGGALKGIDEKFEINTSNGTAGYSIPLSISPGRNGFTPALSLSYNSGSGNSAFGLGLGYWIAGNSKKNR